MSRKQVSGIITMVLALVAASTAGRASAQELVDLKPGQRVRVEMLRPAAGAGEPTTIEGRFESVSADELVLLGEASEMRIPLRDIAVIERKRSRWGAVGKGALYGGLGGVALGVAASGSDDDSWLDASAGEWAIGVGVLGIGAGALIGALAGGGWQDVGLTAAPTSQGVASSPELSWGVLPVRGGGGLGLTIRW